MQSLSDTYGERTRPTPSAGGDVDIYSHQRNGNIQRGTRSSEAKPPVRLAWTTPDRSSATSASGAMTSVMVSPSELYVDQPTPFRITPAVSQLTTQSPPTQMGPAATYASLYTPSATTIDGALFNKYPHMMFANSAPPVAHAYTALSSGLPRGIHNHNISVSSSELYPHPYTYPTMASTSASALMLDTVRLGSAARPDGLQDRFTNNGFSRTDGGVDRGGLTAENLRQDMGSLDNDISALQRALK